ncbi:hypothetical protein [Paraburkholderia sp. MM5384-R2]|uniref:hypothetical protein n=1 Tax=Paraburkholderia sp. MM5384-R2 TaxID=2723097 RepID=UPI00180F99F5|nr:hypothetical protein [Paraburkholderia sp. MM5384-R2]MBB5503187.1 hypothetical protein [Paraburkholderia sp. MM5384-R2]
MHDRFDRRELLLHLGYMLEALSCIARTGRPEALVVQLAKKQNLSQDFRFPQTLGPTMTVAEFSAGVAGAFFLWPRELRDAELNRNALASTVQHDLFDGNPDGWKTYAAHVQKKVKWSGMGLPQMKRAALAEPLHDAAEEAGPVKASVTAAPSVEGHVRNKKRVGLGPTRGLCHDACNSWRRFRTQGARAPKLWL